MKYQVLNDQYYRASGTGAARHFYQALRDRGWLPDSNNYLERERAKEERGRATKTNSQEPDPIRVTSLGTGWREIMLDKDWWLNPPNRRIGY